MKKWVFTILVIASLSAGGAWYWGSEGLLNQSDLQTDSNTLLLQSKVILTAIERYHEKLNQPLHDFKQLYELDLLVESISPEGDLFAAKPQSWRMSQIIFSDSNQARPLVILEQLKPEVVESIQEQKGFSNRGARIDRFQGLDPGPKNASAPLPSALAVDYTQSPDSGPEAQVVKFSMADFHSRTGRRASTYEEFGMKAAQFFFDNNSLSTQDQNEFVLQNKILGLTHPLPPNQTNPHVQFSVDGNPIPNPLSIGSQSPVTYKGSKLIALSDPQAIDYVVTGLTSYSLESLGEIALFKGPDSKSGILILFVE